LTPAPWSVTSCSRRVTELSCFMPDLLLTASFLSRPKPDATAPSTSSGQARAPPCGGRQASAAGPIERMDPFETVRMCSWHSIHRPANLQNDHREVPLPACKGLDEPASRPCVQAHPWCSKGSFVDPVDLVDGRPLQSMRSTRSMVSSPSPMVSGRPCPPAFRVARAAPEVALGRGASAHGLAALRAVGGVRGPLLFACLDAPGGEARGSEGWRGEAGGEHAGWRRPPRPRRGGTPPRRGGSEGGGRRVSGGRGTGALRPLRQAQGNQAQDKAGAPVPRRGDRVRAGGRTGRRIGEG